MRNFKPNRHDDSPKQTITCITQPSNRKPSLSSFQPDGSDSKMLSDPLITNRTTIMRTDFNRSLCNGKILATNVNIEVPMISVADQDTANSKSELQCPSNSACANSLRLPSLCGFGASTVSLLVHVPSVSNVSDQTDDDNSFELPQSDSLKWLPKEVPSLRLTCSMCALFNRRFHSLSDLDFIIKRSNNEDIIVCGKQLHLYHDYHQPQSPKPNLSPIPYFASNPIMIENSKSAPCLCDFKSNDQPQIGQLDVINQTQSEESLTPVAKTCEFEPELVKHCSSTRVNVSPATRNKCESWLQGWTAT